MVKFYTQLGKIELSNDYFASLVSTALQSCYGVAGMHVSGATDGVKAFIFGKDMPDKGITIAKEGEELIIGLHIKLMYGVSIPVIVENIKDRVKYVIEDATELKVKKINVTVDDIVANQI